MKNYCIGFCVSFLLHLTIVGVVFYACAAVPAPESGMLLVDFSALNTGDFNIGGQASGGREGRDGAGEETTQDDAHDAATTQPDAPQPEQTHEPAPVSEPPVQETVTPDLEEPQQIEQEPAPEPDPVPAPKPDPKPEVKKETPKKTERVKPKETQKPAQAHRAPSSAPQAATAGTAAPTGKGQGDAGEGKRAAAPGTGRGTGPGDGEGWEQGASAGYVKSNYGYINSRIAANLEYPSQARRMGWQGVARFSFIIKEDGHVEAVRLMQSSGFPMLDEAAEKAIRQAAPFPPPPARTKIIIPISFRLT